MKKTTLSFRRISPLAAQISLLISLMGFNYSAVADKLVTNKQISQVARIAKETGTQIKVIHKEATTVSIYGNRKKTDKKIKARVYKILKQKNQDSNISFSPAPDYSPSKRPPEIQGLVAPPPVWNGKHAKPPVYKAKTDKPPVLQEGVPHRPPVLEVPAMPTPPPPSLNNGSDTGYY